MSAGVLAGRRVFLGRLRKADHFVAALQEAGAEVECAALTVSVPLDPAQARQAAADLAAGRYDWLVLTSAATLRFLDLDCLSRHQEEAAGGQGAAHRLRLAAVGQATATALTRATGIAPDLVGTSDAEALAAAIIAAQQTPGAHSSQEPRPLRGLRILLPGSELARPLLADALTAAGANVTRVAVYTTEPAPAGSLPEGLVERWQSGHFDLALFTAGSNARAAAALLGQAAPGTRIVTLGLPSHSAAEAAGFAVAAHAVSPTPEGLLTACTQALSP